MKSPCQHYQILTSKTNSGCRGKETVAGLASRGAKVYMGARTESKALSAIEAMQKEIPGANIEFLQMDLTDFKSVVAAARKLRDQETHLHGLINNAGIMGVPFQLTVDGFDSQFQVGHLLSGTPPIDQLTGTC